MSLHKTITLEALADTLEKINGPDQGMRYSANRGGRTRYDPDTGRPYRSGFEAAELTVFSDRADRLYEIICDGPNIAKLIRAALSVHAERAMTDRIRR